MAKEKRIREYIEKRRANLVDQTPLQSPYAEMREADVFDLILQALDTREKCKRIANEYLRRDFERGRADGDGQGPCQVSPQDLYCVLASQRVTPGDIIHAMISVAPQHALKYRDHRSKRNLLHVATYARPFATEDPLIRDPHATEEKNAQKPLDVIRRLIELRPAMLNEEDSNGLTPLSRLILFDTTGHNPGGQPGQQRRWKGEAQIAAVVKLMCEEPFKKCVAKPRSKGAKELPLHLAAGCQMDPKVVADIIEAFPEGIDKPCREGYTALFHCISTMGTLVQAQTTRAGSKNAIKIINHMVKAYAIKHKLMPSSPNEVPTAANRTAMLGVWQGLVDGTLRVTWVQPRVLQSAQVGLMKERLQTWTGTVNKTLTFLQDETPEFSSS